MKRFSPALNFFLGKTILFLLLFSYNSSVFAQECGVVYVSATGASSGATGTKSNPASLLHGLSLVASGGTIKMAAGTYNISNQIVIPSNVIIEGGFSAATWVKKNTTPTVINRDNSNIIQSPPRLVGISAINSSGFRLLDLSINVANAPPGGISIYGIYLNGCSDYIISRCKITTGKASDGAAGIAGSPGTNGGAGTIGSPGIDEGNCCFAGGVGGSGSFPGSNAGGTGGNGGERGGFDRRLECLFGYCAWLVDPGSDYTNNGNPGAQGAGSNGGGGGLAGTGLCYATYVNSNCIAGQVNHGRPGLDGLDGLNGFNGNQGIATYAGGFYLPGDGALGNNGFSDGSGGGGGGGGGAKGCEPAALHPLTGDTAYFTSGAGAGGGGGGEGGQRGLGGQGGTGGGGNFCIFVFNNGINGIIQDGAYNPGQGGEGGAGGAGGPGGIGGNGGAGGNLADNGPNNSCNNGEGGRGGRGGNGGNGGAGGKGSDGISANIVEKEGTPVLRPNTFNPWEPEVTVEYFGCTNSDIKVTTDATGILNWVFGFGASPSTGSGTSDTVQYSGPSGFRNITLIVDGVPYSYVNFVNIQTQFTPPKITKSATAVCAGQSIDFSTTFAGDSYAWEIPGGSITTSTQQNPGSVTFNTAGEYVIKLATTSCCGTSRTSDTIYVMDAVEVDLGDDLSICFTDPAPVLDAGGYAGAIYNWTFNGGPLGQSTSKINTQGPGTYNVTVDYGGGCNAADDLLLEVFINLPVDLGQAVGVCMGDSFPLLDAGFPGSSYMWSFNGNPVGTDNQLLLTNLQGTYAVTVTSATGCVGNHSVDVILSVPQVDLGFNINMCDNEPFPILNAANLGATYSWSLNGSVLPDTLQHLQTTSGGSYAVTITDRFGCTTSDNASVTVIPSLNAGFSAPSQIMVGSTAQFTDNTNPAPTSWNWNFGDGSPNDSVQNPTHAYSSAGIFPIFLIANNAFCGDTIIGQIEVLNDCNSLGLTASFSMSNDSVILNESGNVILTNTSVNGVTYSWTFGDGSAVSYEANPIHAYGTEGVYTITLTVKNYNCTATSSQTIIVVKEVVGVNESIVADELLIFPNPSNGIITIRMETQNQEDTYLEITNIFGQRIFRDFIGKKAYYEQKLDLSNFSKGLYFLNMTSSSKYIQRKIVLE